MIAFDSKLAANGADQIHQGCSGLPEIKVFVTEMWKWESINFVLLGVIIKSYLVISCGLDSFQFSYFSAQEICAKKPQSL